MVGYSIWPQCTSNYPYHLLMYNCNSLLYFGRCATSPIRTTVWVLPTHCAIHCFGLLVICWFLQMRCNLRNKDVALYRKLTTSNSIWWIWLISVSCVFVQERAFLKMLPQVYYQRHIWCAQGSHLGPLLFKLFIKDLSLSLTSS